jgi:hypothetical protein
MLEKIKLAIGIALLALTPVMAADNWREYSQLMGDGGLVETTAVITHVKRHIGKGSRRRKYTVRYVFEDELRRSWTGEQRIWWSENLEPSKTIKISYRPSNPRANAIYPSALWTDVLISSILAILAMILLSGGFWAFIHERRRKQRYTRSARSNELLLEREPRRAPPPHDVSAQPDGGTAAEPSYAQWARGRKLQQPLQREQHRAPPPAVPPFRIRNVPSLRIRIPSLRTCKKEEH